MIADPVFGNLLDLDQRLARHLEDLDGVKHRHQIEPADPAPGQPIRLSVTTSGSMPIAAVDCWYATEAPGTISSMTEPVAEHRLSLLPAGADWDAAEWRYLRRWTGLLPPQPAGTMVRYRLAGRRAGSESWVYADNQAAMAQQATEFAIWVD